MRADTALVAGTIGGLTHYNAPETRNCSCCVRRVKLSQH
jgi:hypothetical protein